MSIILVTNNSDDWPSKVSNVDLVDAHDYLTNPSFSELRGAKVFNLCRSYRYQSVGYYVSLLAEARGHKPLPSIATIQDFKTHAIVRLVSDELDELIQTSLASIKSDKFTLSIYFGQNMAHRYARLALHLFNQFPAPLMRAQFTHAADNGWQLRRIAPISANDVPASHWVFLSQVATDHFAGRRPGVTRRSPTRFDLAILCNPDDPQPPSNERAIKKFVKAATSLEIGTEVITRDDYGRLPEFDALFIRDTTFVNNYTYRFARRAAGEGMVVMDDPQSIVRCTNKVYLAELLTRHKVPMPRSLVIHRENTNLLAPTLGFPCVLKKPDSSFSRGVVKVENEIDAAERLDEFFAESEMIVAQEFLPTTFDWRIGILDRQPLYACKYFMAQGHWQIINQNGTEKDRYGRSETVPVELAPRRAVAAALKAANLVGDGLYGVDVKESAGKFYVIEVNDNPNLDAGFEDAVLKDELYRRIMQVFLRRIELRKAATR